MNQQHQLHLSLLQRINDLENTLIINKGIIVTLSQGISNPDTAQIIRKLADETQQLQIKLSEKSYSPIVEAYNKLANEYDSIQAKQKQYTKYLMDEISALKQQALAKEYTIQYYENKINGFCKSLRRESIESKKLEVLIKELCRKGNNRENIHNVIGENEELKCKMKEWQREISVLRRTIDELSSSEQLNDKLCSNTSEFSFKKRDAGLKISKSVLSFCRNNTELRNSIMTESSQ